MLQLGLCNVLHALDLSSGPIQSPFSYAIRNIKVPNKTRVKPKCTSSAQEA